jgi:hypothetical protein
MTTDNTVKRGEGIKIVLEKLEKSIQAGDFYSAQQLYKTIYFRFFFFLSQYSTLLETLNLDC